MKPPILEWKMMLALLAVVVVGVSLGSALRSDVHSDASPLRGFHNYGSVSIYDSTGNVTPQTRRKLQHKLCASLKRQTEMARSRVASVLPQAPLT